MSFLSSLLEFKTRITFKHLTVLVLSLMFLSYNCADGSVDDDDEEEEELLTPPVNVTKPEEYSQNPTKVDTLEDLPKEYKDDTIHIPPNQFSVFDFSKPKKNSKNKIGFKAKNLLYGNYSHLPRVNLWLVLMTKLLNLASKRRRERRRLDDTEVDVDCRNPENIPNQEITNTFVDFTCESKEDAPDDLDKTEIKVAKIEGEEAPEYIANQYLSKKDTELSSSNTKIESYKIERIGEISSGSITLLGSGYDISNLEGPFNVNLKTGIKS